MKLIRDRRVGGSVREKEYKVIPLSSLVCPLRERRMVD